MAGFDKSALPPPGPFYQTELGNLTRPDRHGWAKGRCPWHQSKSGRSFSVNVNSGSFRCWGCDVHGGDLISFIRMRDHCDFKRACITLGIWREHVTPEDRRHLDEQKRERDRRRAEAERQRRERFVLRDDIHADQCLVNQLSERLRQSQDDETLWACLELAVQCRELSEREYSRAIGLEDNES